MTTQEIIRTCKTHGNLTIENCIKARINKNGTQAYRCKLCMQELHRKHYEKHREIVLQNQRDYKAANPDKVKASKQKYEKKLWADNKDNPEFREAQREHKRQWRKANATAERARDKRYTRKIVDELGDAYIKDKLKRGTTLKSEDLTPPLIELKRTVMLIKRLIRIKSNEVKHD